MNRRKLLSLLPLSICGVTLVSKTRRVEAFVDQASNLRPQWKNPPALPFYFEEHLRQIGDESRKRLYRELER